MKAIEDYFSIKPIVFSIVLDQQLRFFFLLNERAKAPTKMNLIPLDWKLLTIPTMNTQMIWASQLKKWGTNASKQGKKI